MKTMKKETLPIDQFDREKIPEESAGILTSFLWFRSVLSDILERTIYHHFFCALL